MFFNLNPNFGINRLIASKTSNESIEVFHYLGLKHHIEVGSSLNDVIPSKISTRMD